MALVAGEISRLDSLLRFSRIFGAGLGAAARAIGGGIWGMAARRIGCRGPWLGGRCLGSWC